MGLIFGWMTGKTLAERFDEYEKIIKMLEYEEKNPKIKPKTKKEIIDNLINCSQVKPEKIFENLKTSAEGLTQKEAKKRLFQYRKNEINQEKRDYWLIRILKIIANPLIALLLFIILISFFTQDYKTTVVISIMVFVSVTLRFFQENQAYNSAESLKSLIKTTCTVIRNHKKKEIDLKEVVPGDIIELTAGDVIPADLRIIKSNELFLNQSILTGEALPVEKNHLEYKDFNEKTSLFELKNICFSGSNVESGYGIGIVLQTGISTYFGNLVKDIAGQKIKTSFDKGIDNFTLLMIGFMAIMSPTVFLINGIIKGNWFESFLFAISIAVGLTPEMLPAIVTVNLSQGSINMAKKKVIVKDLSSIQNLGAMDIVCTDKTGTLTLNKVTLIKCLNINGEIDKQTLHYAYINSYYQTGFKNLLDTAILKHAKKNQVDEIAKEYKKIHELPFDFIRKRVSLIVENKKKERLIICKGAVEEVLTISNFYELDNKEYSLTNKLKEKIKQMNDQFSQEGYRVIAVAHKYLDKINNKKTAEYENNLIFSGIIIFLDPPKETANQAIKKLTQYGIEVKILTGDNELVTKKIAQEVGITIKRVILGNEIEKLDEKTLVEKVKQTTIFAKLSPDHKRKIVNALKKSHRVVGFIGDGINDAPALRIADVGISVDNAVDIAKESSSLILLEQSLNVLADGVIEGRRVFGNIVKYIKMGASSNFGNMFSVLGASIFLPFLPMTPSQILVNNLLYDLSQTAIPLDNVDSEYIKKPRRWQIKDIGRFMIFIGPISSIFDYLTYFMMLFIFNAWTNPSLFQTGWFVESLTTQTLIIHVIRSRKTPFLQTWASKPLVLTTLIVVSIGIFLTFSSFNHYFNFVRLPFLYWPLLFLIIISYILLTQIVKIWYIKKYGYN